jgi:hypothetical protein
VAFVRKPYHERDRVFFATEECSGQENSLVTLRFIKGIIGDPEAILFNRFVVRQLLVMHLPIFRSPERSLSCEGIRNTFFPKKMTVDRSEPAMEPIGVIPDFQLVSVRAPADDAPTMTTS